MSGIPHLTPSNLGHCLVSTQRKMHSLAIMTEDTQRVKNGQSRTNELWFDLTSWWRPDITCFSNAQKMCIASGLSGLSALLLTIACFMLVCRRCRSRDRNSGEAACVLYSFLGNVCSTVGAFLSNQLALQVLMGGVTATVEVIHLISLLIPTCLCGKTRAERRLRMKRRRRRQNLMAVPLLLLVVVGGGSYLTSRNSLQPIDRPLTGRRLFTDLLLDSTEVLGYILGLLSLVIAWTSRFPALLRAHRGEMSSASHLSTGVLCFLAWALYTSAILLYNTQYEFVLRATPWLLASTGCAALDLAIVVLFWCRKVTVDQELGGGSPDTESLLRSSSTAAQHNPRGEKKKHPGLDSTPLHVPANKKHLNMLVEMGHYMDVTMQPVRKVCLKEVTLSRETGAPTGHPLRRTVRVVRVDEPFTSETISDSSSLNSDLEVRFRKWDFEEANAPWDKLPKEQEKGDEFPLQEWPKPTSVCSCETEQAGKSIKPSG
ncbi:transmembrane protein 44 isoform X3 [Esox lucius]|uniref:transmembrane protein 44 isoform X3 n=1 Tax=Esox lucius TaxID=8010 RepID=UPI001476A7FC|nr:transmembrane protein 44 isoform X3 [Esox lucius]